MKVEEVKETPKHKFEPKTIQITIETREELEALCHRIFATITQISVKSPLNQYSDETLMAELKHFLLKVQE